MKKFLLPIISAVVCALLCANLFAAETIEIKMTIGENVGYVNGEAKELDAAPIIRGNRTMLPVRFVAENLGAAVTWDGETSTATLTTDAVEIKITIGKTSATVNGEEKALDAPAFIENSRTYLPVRFVAENLGATVTWDGETSTATITLGGYVPFPDDYTLKYPNLFDYVAEDLTEFITLGNYKGQQIETSIPPEITDEDVKSHINSLLLENPARVEVTDRGAENGDNIVVNFIGKVDGVAFEGGSAYDYEITLGDGGFIDGFEEGMVGMKAGETKNIDVVFPENYGSADLAGKPAVFEITMLSIYKEEPAALTDEYVKATFGYNTVAEFEEATKAELLAEREKEILDVKATEALRIARDTSVVIKFPDGLVEDYMFQQISTIKESAAEYGMTYEMILTYSGFTVETFENYMRSTAESTATNELVIMSIAKAENLIPTDEERDAYVSQELLSQFAAFGITTVEEMCTLTGFDAEYIYNIAKFNLISENVRAFLAENNTYKG